MANDVLAEARVRIRADGSQLRGDIKDQAGSAAREAGTSAGRDFGSRFGRSAQAALSAAQPKLDVNIARARERLQQLEQAAARLGDRKITVDADIARAKAKLEELQRLKEAKLDAAFARKLKLDADVSQAELRLAELRDRAAFATGDRKLKIDADIASAEAHIAELRARADSIPDIKLKADAEIAAAQAKLRDLEREKETLGTGVTKVRVDAEIDQAKAHLRELENGRPKDSSFRIDGDVAGALAKVAALAAAIGGISVLAVGAAGALSGIGAAGAAGTLAAVGGFLGVGDALKAMGAKADAAGASVKVSASAVRSATAAVAQSQRDYRDSLDAVQVASRGVEAAHRSIEQAARGVEAATRAVGAAQRDHEAALRGVASAEAGYQASLRAVSDAERSYQDSLRSEEQAQRSVNDARAEAEAQLKDLKLATEDMALSQEDAALSVQEAQKRLADVMADPKATNLEKARAELAVRQAQQRQKDLAQSASELAAKRAAADAKGVEGSDAVTAAQDRLRQSQAGVASAQQRIADAHQGVADAAQRVTDANQGVADSEQKITDALQGVTDARQKVADAQQGELDSEKKLAKARENVTVSLQKITDAQLRLAETKNPVGGAAAATDKLALAMANLGPKGQQFVTFLRSFVDNDLKKLRQAGQEEFLPGIQSGLEKLRPMMASITPAWAEFSRVAGQALGGLIPVIGQLAPAFLRFSSASLQGLQPIEGSLARFSTALGATLDRMSQTGEAQQAMGVLANVVDSLLQLLPKLIEGGAKTLIALGPGLTDVIKALSGGIGGSLPNIVSMAGAFSTLLSAVAPVSPELAVAITALVGLKKIGALGPLVDLATAALGRLRSGAKDAGAAVEGAAAASERAGGRFSGLQAGIGRVGLALAATQVASAAFGHSAEVGLAPATKALEDYARSGTSSSEVTNHLKYDLDSIANSSFGDRLSNGTAKAIEGFTGLGAVMDQSVQHATERLSSLDQALAGLVAGGKADVAAQAFGRLAAQAQAQDIPIERLKEVLPAYQTALSAAATGTDAAAGAMGRLQLATVSVNNAFLSARNAESGYFASLDAVTQALAANGKGMDVHTAKGRANQQALDGLAQASAAYLQSILDQQGPGAAFDAQLGKTQAQLVAAGQRLGLTRGDAVAYAKSILQIPTARSTTFRNNAASAAAAVDNLTQRIALVQGKTVYIHVVADNANARESRPSVVNPTGRSRGGRLPGAPSIRDTIPALLAQGEYVIRSAQASRWGSLLDRINAGATPESLLQVAQAGQETATTSGNVTISQSSSSDGQNNAEILAAMQEMVAHMRAMAQAALQRTEVKLDNRIIGALDAAWGKGAFT